VEELAQVGFNWKDAEIVDFKVVSEDWKHYALSDGAKLKIKLVLGQVWRSPSQHDPLTGEPLYMWNAHHLTSLVSFPAQLRGQPSNIPVTPQAVEENFDQAVGFEILGKDEWNVYNFTDGTILQVRPSLISVSRTRLRGQAGEPVYDAAGGPPDCTLKVPENLIKKPEARSSSTKSPAYG
jgi:hypothetical protein